MPEVCALQCSSKFESIHSFVTVTLNAPTGAQDHGLGLESTTNDGKEERRPRRLRIPRIPSGEGERERESNRNLTGQ